jgi:ligand-binding SRPBCC domain-containing protein
MKTFTLDSGLWLGRPIQEVFAFFCDPANLEKITPPWLRFEIKSAGPMELREGSLIDYRLRLHGIPLSWRSRISIWDPPHRFVDEQVRGPYRLWRHEHTFAEQNGGTMVRDHVDYAVPGGWLIHKLMVERDVEKIFEFRHRKLSEIFR